MKLEQSNVIGFVSKNLKSLLNNQSIFDLFYVRYPSLHIYFYRITHCKCTSVHSFNSFITFTYCTMLWNVAELDFKRAHTHKHALKTFPWTGNGLVCGISHPHSSSQSTDCQIIFTVCCVLRCVSGLMHCFTGIRTGIHKLFPTELWELLLTRHRDTSLFCICLQAERDALHSRGYSWTLTKVECAPEGSPQIIHPVFNTRRSKEKCFHI